ncbi:hypothetical protein CRUP_034414 [Coryphaenoides rupestris]|nr:hypothetical protein CRUP_034414 [Coryphaenoides rupestris]
MHMGLVGSSPVRGDQDGILVGAVGAYDWNGAVLKETRQGKVIPPKSSYTQEFPEELKNHGAYLGYAVTSVVSARSGRLLVAGAPRFNHTGKVIIFTLKNTGNLTILHSLKGQQNRFILEGALEIHNGGQNARFGSALAPVPDLNGDGFNDLVVGAPLEDDHKGAVYIFFSQQNRILRKYKQRIAAVDLASGLRYFGRHIHGRMDMNEDGLVDLAVGSFGAAVLLWSRSVVRIHAKVRFEPNKVNIFVRDCQRGGKDVTCMSAIVCLNVTARTAIPPTQEIAIKYNVSIAERRFNPRAVMDSLDKLQPQNLTLLPGQEICEHVYFHVVLPFWNGCDEDDRCMPDLALQSVTDLDNADVPVECDGDGRLKDAKLCNVSAPFMRAKTQVTLRLEFEFTRSVLLDHVRIILHATSDGEETSLSDNYNDIHYTLKYQTDLLFTRDSYPRRYDIKSDLSLEEPGVIGPPFNFTFQIQNLGFFPVRDLQLNIEIPEMTKNGNQLLRIADLYIDQTDGTQCVPPQHVAQSRASPEDLSRFSRLNQSNTLTLPVQCTVQLDSCRQVDVRITGVLRIDTLHTLQFKILELVTSASVELASASPLFLHEDRPLRHIVLEIRKEGDYRISIWIIIGSTLGGLLLLALLSLALWKLGFFQRQKRRDEDEHPANGKVAEDR